MRSVWDPFQFFVIAFAGRVNQHQQQLVEYLLEENRVLREQIGSRRMRFNDDQRRRLDATKSSLDEKISLNVSALLVNPSLSGWCSDFPSEFQGPVRPHE